MKINDGQMRCVVGLMFVVCIGLSLACSGGGGGGSSGGGDGGSTTYYISGYVKTSSGTGISGVTVTCTSGASSYSDTTDSSGYYQVTGLPSGTYTVTATMSGYTFSPSSQTVIVSSNGNVTDINFTSTTGQTTSVTAELTRTGDWTTGFTYTYSYTITAGSEPLTYNVKLEGERIMWLTNNGYLESNSTVTVSDTLEYGYRFSEICVEVSDLSVGENGRICFEATEDSITVTSPNGGEDWKQGSTHNITWTSTGSISSVTIYLYKGGSYSGTIASAISNSGSYSWTISSSQTTGSDYKVRIVKHGDASIYDESNSNFTISPSSVTNSITVTSPNGGEDWKQGSTHNITWTSAGSVGTHVDIKLLKSVTNYATIASSTENDGTYSWTIPMGYEVGSEYRIAVVSTSDDNWWDISDSYFTISEGEAESITVISPNGGENWKFGETHDITWTSTGDISAVTIHLYKGGGLYGGMANNTSNDGSYSWTIPSFYEAGSDYRIRIYKYGDDSVYDESDTDFAISNESGILHYEATTGGDGKAVFSVPGVGLPQVTVIDDRTGDPISGITVFLITDGTDGAYLLIDQQGRYAPIIVNAETASQQSSYRQSDSSDNGVPRVITLALEIWLTILSSIRGDEPDPIHTDNVPYDINVEILNKYYDFKRSTYLRDLAATLEDLVEQGADYFVIDKLLNLGGPVGIAINVVELAITANYGWVANEYAGLGYGEYDWFDIYTLKPEYTSGTNYKNTVIWPRASAPSNQSGSIAGKVTNATTGNEIANARVSLSPAYATWRYTDSLGNYTFSGIPEGDNLYTVAAKKPEYDRGRVTQISVTAGSTTTANIALNPIVPPEQTYRIVLQWQQSTEDLDAHLWTPQIEGLFYHLFTELLPGGYYGSLTTAPYAQLDHDDRTMPGDETFTIKTLYSGIYYYAVQYYDNWHAGDIKQSGAVVDVYDSTGRLKTIKVSDASGSGIWWNVLQIDGDTGVITTINTLGNSSPQ